MFRKIFLLISLLCGISMHAQANINANNKQTSVILNKVFSYDMLYADLTYLESIIGVAKKTNYDYLEKTYLLNGCNITVGFNDRNQVTSLAIDINKKCSFNLNNFVKLGNGKNFPVNQLKFGQLNGQYYADCLKDICGNAADPFVYEYYEGPRSEQNIEIIISSIRHNNTKAWSDAIIKNDGEDWLMESKYNCNPEKYKSIAKRSLSGLPAEQIVIGYNIKSKVFGYIQCNN